MVLAGKPSSLQPPVTIRKPDVGVPVHTAITGSNPATVKLASVALMFTYSTAAPVVYVYQTVSAIWPSAALNAAGAGLTNVTFLQVIIGSVASTVARLTFATVPLCGVAGVSATGAAGLLIWIALVHVSFAGAVCAQTAFAQPARAIRDRARNAVPAVCRFIPLAPMK
ncbi:hypothetical protein [Dokdonella soli]|uniref:hypothetical protein n=1 Tax=Dokdonella soli TaxID=529810 RepID=UPI0031D7CE07